LQSEAHDQGLLDDIGSVDSCDEPAVKPRRDHPMEVVAVRPQQPMAGRLVPVARPVNQVLGIREHVSHDRCPFQGVPRETAGRSYARSPNSPMFDDLLSMTLRA
jgi:hypothetical protein